MVVCGKTSFVYILNSCNSYLNSNNPYSRYQKQKIIQNTVRVPCSLYTMNLGSLNVYEKPDTKVQTIYVDGTSYLASPNVNWNQMSDRKSPHKQVAVTASGSIYRGNSLKHSIVRMRPGSLSPGGTGCDIKHNSYDRYLNRIKGKAPLRRGTITPLFVENNIPFNRAYPIYGGKTLKSNIVNGCNCENLISEKVTYDNFIDDSIQFNNIYKVGDTVYTLSNNTLEKGIILSVTNNIYQVKLEDKTIVYKNMLDLTPYLKRYCNNTSHEKEFLAGYLTSNGTISKCFLKSNLII